MTRRPETLDVGLLFFIENRVENENLKFEKNRSKKNENQRICLKTVSLILMFYEDSEFSD